MNEEVSEFIMLLIYIGIPMSSPLLCKGEIDGCFLFLFLESDHFESPVFLPLNPAPKRVAKFSFLTF